MKTIKRIIAVVFLMFLVLLIGYSCYTGSRLTSYPRDLDIYNDKIFYGEDDGMIAFIDGYAWYKAEEQGIDLFKIEAYEQGTILISRNDKEYAFTAIDCNTIFDEQSNMILEWRQEDG